MYILIYVQPIILVGFNTIKVPCSTYNLYVLYCMYDLTSIGRLILLGNPAILPDFWVPTKVSSDCGQDCIV